MYSAPGCIDMTRYGFPHSDIHGSTLVFNSPWLFAAYHVLHRLLAPRHPPSALNSLTTKPLSSSELPPTPTKTRYRTCSPFESSAGLALLPVCSIPVSQTGQSSIASPRFRGSTRCSVSLSKLISTFRTLQLFMCSSLRHLFSCQDAGCSAAGWAWKDLNFRPRAYQARALTS